MEWNLKKIFHKNGTTIVRKTYDEKRRRLDEETVKRINERLTQYSSAENLDERKTVLKEWQKEAITKGNTWFEEDEDR